MKRSRLSLGLLCLMLLVGITAPASADVGVLPGAPNQPILVETDASLPHCTADQIQSVQAALPTYNPSNTSGFVTVSGSQFMLGTTPFYPRGVNYYPVLYPWRRFLTEMDVNAITPELDLIRSEGFNTLRIYLWNEALFQCIGSGAIPIPDRFQRLDNFIQAAAQRGFRLIITLNDMPDLTAFPLYNNPNFIQAQTTFIVTRYRSEAAIMAWDMRNGGDLDYGTENNYQGPFTRQQVLTWLWQTSQLIHAYDPNHLVTAGWVHDAESTLSYVDFPTFHHWEGPDTLALNLSRLRSFTGKPIMIGGIGFTTFQRSEEEQAQLLGQSVDILEAEGVPGWLIWTAFDFPLDRTCVGSGCVSADNRDHHFGLWRTDYSAKPAVAEIPLN